MHTKCTTQEKLKDLRVARGLTLAQLSDATGISSSTLGDYETNEYKDIASRSLIILAKYYGVSSDYLLGLSDNISESATPLEELHLTDTAINILKNGAVNTRLLSEMIAHPTFVQMLIDSEIYVDRIAAGRINDMNSMLEAVRQTVIERTGANSDDLYMQTLKTAQVSEDDFFASAITRDIMTILTSIRDTHISDSTTADASATDMIKSAFDEVNSYKGSAEEAQCAFFLKQLGINYSRLTKEEFVTLMGILDKSALLKAPGKGRGKGTRKKK